MNQRYQFTKLVEKKITPKGLAKFHKNADKLMKLPLSVQKYIVNKASNKDELMGFVVEPYSTFLTFEINYQDVSTYIPSGYTLVPTSLFDDGHEKYVAIIGCFNVHTTVFYGTRYELYLIAKNNTTNMISWLICDYESNTFNYAPKSGFVKETTNDCLLTTSFDGNIIGYFKSTNNILDFRLNLNESKPNYLNQELWIEGNLSIDYSHNLNNNTKSLFGMVFDPLEMKKANKVELNKVTIKDINFSFINNKSKLIEICVFPFAQHYITTVFPKESNLKNSTDLYNEITDIIKNN